ncbi:MAG: hypothetical protein RIB60_03115 [Phycisphaerales bacterium]
MKSPVLFHARGRMTPDECAFHARLDNDLRARGSHLALITHHPPAVPLGAHHAVVPNGLEPLGRAGGGDAAADLAGLDRAVLLEREVMWRGRPRSDAHATLRHAGIDNAARIYARALDELDPTSCIIWNGQHPQEMVLAALCAARDIPVVHLERGPFPGTLHPDARGVLGGSSVAALTGWPEPNAAALAVFDRVASHLNAGAQTWWAQPDPLGPDGVRRVLGIPGGARVALFFGQVDEDAQNILHAPGYDSNLDAFASWLDAVPREGWFVLGKHHPKSSTSPEAYRAALRASGVAGAWTDEVSLIDALCVANRAAAVNSSALYESLLAGLPVQMLGRAILSNKGIAFGAGEPFFELSADEHTRRAARWRSFGAWFLTTRLCAMSPALTDLGVPGPALLAEAALANQRSMRWTA